MKTYERTVTTTEPRLVISHDESAESPRNDDNLGHFITVDSNYYSPDKNETLESIVKANGDRAKNQADHIRMIKNGIEAETDEKVLAIYPVTKYEHSGVSYSLGSFHGFDHSNNGFYIVTEKSQKVVGTEKKDFEKVIQAEIDLYNKYVGGEIYQFVLIDKDGEFEDSCCGFYKIEDIREHLPEEWKNEDLEKYYEI